MGILDKIFKKEKAPETGKRRRRIMTRDNPYAKVNSAIGDALAVSMYSYLSKQMNTNPHDQQKLKDCYFDPCVNAAVNTRFEGLCDMSLVIETDNENLRQFVYDQINPILHKTIVHSIWSEFLGFSVGELLWEDVGPLLRIKDFFPRDFKSFKPLPDGCSVIYKRPNDYKINYTADDIEPYGKYLLCVNNGCPENAYGEALFQSLYYLIKIRSFGYRSWAKWLERFGQPFLWGQIDSKDEKECEKFMDELDCAIDASSIVTDMESQITVIDAKGGKGEHFKSFNDCIKKEIQQAILGQNLTSEVSSASLAAAQVHNEVRRDKVKSDARKVNAAIQKLIKMIVDYNGITEDVTGYLKEKDGIEMERAQRDALLVSSGILTFTDQYIGDRYDFVEGDFQLGESTQETTPFKSNTKAVNLQNQTNIRRLDELVDFMIGLDLDPFDSDELLDAIQSIENKNDFYNQIKAVVAETDTIKFEEMLSMALYYALHEGVDSHARS